MLVKVILTDIMQLKQLQRKPRNSEASNGSTGTHDLRDTGAMLYPLSYEALLVGGTNLSGNFIK